MIEIKGSNIVATIKNIHFVGGDVYAVKSNGGVKSLTVENCTAKDYDYGFLYVNKTTTNVVVKDATISDCNYGIRYSYGTTMTVENVVMSNVKNGLEVQNFASKSVTIKNSVITSIVIDERTKDGVPYTGVQTFNFVGDNTVGTLSTSQYAKYVLANKDATLAASEGFTVTVNDENYAVTYANGTYYAVEKNFVAQVGDKKYVSLAAAIEAAQNGDTVVLIKDIDLANEEFDVLDGAYNTYFLVEGKTITVDLNGKTISGAYTDTNTMLVGVFSTDNDGHLTLTGNGTVNVIATNAVYSLIANYEAGCSITIENGTFTLDKAIDSLIYSGGDAGENEGVTVNGGTFTLGNVGDGTNGKPWIFNCLGANDNNVVVNGGTFNADIANQYWVGEVYIPVDKHCVDNGDGTWTVMESIPGDVDEDGDLTAMDVVLLRRYIAGLTNNTVSSALADVNRDGSIDTMDVVKLRQLIAANN